MPTWFDRKTRTSNISDGKNRKKFEATEIAVQVDLKREELRILK